MAVRREAVRLSLEDDFSRQMLAAAASTKTLEGALRSLDGTSVRTSDSLNSTTDSNNSLSQSATQSMATIDRYSGRMGLLLKTAAALGPALVPIGAVGVAGVAGLASQLGFATLGMSSLLIAAQGVGDAITAVNEARLDPTIENIQKAREALEGLDPAAQAFVQRFQEFRPVLTDIRNAAAAGFFPGLIDALDSFERIAPDVADLMQVLGTTGGNLIADAAEALAGPEWSQFLAFLEREAPRAFEELGHTVGNLARGMAELWMAFTPLNQDFSSWMLDASRGFAEWADGLSQTEGFEEFIAYVRENGPKVADATVAIANAILQIAEAAAPLGGPILEGITSFANAVAAIADSPLGTPIMVAVTAMSALSLATAATNAAVTRLNASMALLGVTSKRTAAASAAATAAGGAGAAGAAGGGAAVGGPAVLGGMLALLNAYNLVKNTKDLFEGDMPLWEYATRGLVPAVGVMEVFGVNLLDTATYTKEVAWGFNRTAIEAKLLGGDLGRLTDETGRLGQENAALDPVLARTERAMRDQARATREQERASARAEAQMIRQNAAIRAQQDAAQAAAEGFVNFGRVVKAENFTLDGWLDKLESQTDAMRRFRENAVTAAEKGLDLDFIQHLRESGREGAVQLKHLADATEAEIARANRAWRTFQRESNAARRPVGALTDDLRRLGLLDAKPKVSLDGAAKAAAAAARARAAVEAIPDKSHTKVDESGAAKVAAAAARARAAVLGIPDKSDTRINESGAAKVAAAAARARAAITSIPGKSDTRIDENGAAETAAAAARARAAILSIPTSRTSTLTFRTIGTPGFSSGGYTGNIPTHQVAGPVHGREVVLPADIVRRDAAMLKERYGHLPGMGALRGSERRVGSGGGSQRIDVNLGDLRVVGTLKTPWGPAEVEGIARGVYRDEAGQDRNFKRQQGYGRG